MTLFSNLSKLRLSVPQWASMRKRKVERRIQEYVGSPDDDRAQAVFSGFGLAQISIFLISIPFGIIGAKEGKVELWQSVSILCVAILSLLILLYIFWLDIKVAGFYKIRSRYERRVRHLLERQPDLNYYLRIWRLMSLRVLTTVCAILLLFEALMAFALAFVAAKGFFT